MMVLCLPLMVTIKEEIMEDKTSEDYLKQIQTGDFRLIPKQKEENKDEDNRSDI